MKIRHALLVGLTLAAFALLLPPMPQPLAGHDLADKREACGVENFLGVTSNPVFTLAGLAGLAVVLRRRTRFEPPAVRRPGRTWCSRSGCC